jgi:hypothetical protein
MKQELDITGRRFGRLTALYRDGYSNGWQLVWVCRCDCGKIVRVEKNNLTRGRTKSCGCLRRELIEKRHHDKATVGHTEAEG